MAQCGDSCGWIAALISAVAYGSYGVPIKATLDIDVHPLVLQSYKTIVLFLTCWFVLAFGEEVKFTPFGLLSGFLWVSGGTFGIFAIRNAGMATAIGTWASVMVLVNFVWGIMIFQEPINSFGGTLLSFILLGSGLIGMSKYSSKKAKAHKRDSAADGIEMMTNKSTKPSLVSRKNSNGSFDDGDVENDEIKPMLSNDDDTKSTRDHEDTIDPRMTTIVVLGYRLHLTPRDKGIACAVMNGILAGSSLIPLHYAKKQGFGRLGYVISFGSGAFVANITIWLMFFLHQHLEKYKQDNANSIRNTFDTMPSFHLRELWLRGLAAGVLLSIGQFSSIMATSILGQGVGNSLVQSKIIVSGLWGIFFYKEVQNPDMIKKWFLSASMTVFGILLLSYERLVATSKLQH